MAAETMDSERWQRLKEILNKVDDLPDGERQDYLARACRSDAGMLREAQALLGFDDGLERLVEQPLVGPDAIEEKNIGRRVGSYRLQRLLGRGGMGSVYLAVRRDDFDQRVALKLVNLGAHTREIIDRFLNERQILAHLEHPSIARLLDGGTTEDGLPYFVMEYVDGVPIDEYCEENQLSVRQRLELFRQVCSAVHLAHQSLVVHRDIKPSNILITPDGLPKLLDFGIAKILHPPDSEGRQKIEIVDRRLETEAGHHPMTSNYASPEQILDEVITTASDVYSLGVLLYRLLSRHAPYQLAGKSLTEKIQKVCHEDPTRPSVAVTQHPTDSAEGGPGKNEAGRLHRRLAGDLDAIVLKAMRKEPRHRYHSAEQLSDDIRRHLEDEPILARHGTWTYLTGKYLRRHKLGLGVVLLSISFAVSTTVLWVQAVEERERALKERNRSQRVVEFLQDLFLASDPDETQGREVTAREILDRGRQDLAEGLEGESETQAYLLRALGVVYGNLGLQETAREVKERALELRRQVSSPDDPELATDIANLAKLEYDAGDYEAAEKHYREALRIRQALGKSPLNVARTLGNLANTLSQQGQYAAAEEIQSQVLEIRIRALGESDLDVAWTRYSLGVINYAYGDLEKTEDLLRRALDTYLEQVGAENTRVASIQGFLGLTLHELKQFEEAEHALRSSLDIRRKLLGEDHKAVAIAKTRLAALLLSRGQTTAAGTLLIQALPFLRENLVDGSWILAEAEGIYGSYLVESGRVEEAETYLRRSYALIRNAKGDETTYTRIALRRLRDLDEALRVVGERP